MIVVIYKLFCIFVVNKNKNMIDAKDLRIGNWITRKDLGDNSDRYETIILLGEKATTTGPIKVIIDYEELTGIPLTEEWLLKAGLISDSQRLVFEMPEYIKEKCNGDIGYKAPAYFFNKRLNRWMDCQTRVCVDFVHQVQNHVFALTGEELEFK